VEPAGCGYWRRAAAGTCSSPRPTTTSPCPLGAHTHNVTLSPAEQQELMGLVQTMVGLSYLRIADVARIPTRNTPLKVAVYAPLAPPRCHRTWCRSAVRAAVDALAEAAQVAGVAGTVATMGRPTCAVCCRIDSSLCCTPSAPVSADGSI
jgi:hypothetical protein